MNPGNSIKIAFIISMLFHTFIVLGPAMNILLQKSPVRQYEITYSRAAEKPNVKEKTYVKTAQIRKGRLLAQVQRKIQKTKTAQKQQAQPKKDIIQPAAKDKDADIIIPPLPAGIEKMPAYLDYVQSVREKIKRVASSRYRQASTGGEVLLHFVLLSDGSLSAVKIVNDRSCSDQKLRQLAREAIEYASPFEPFPQDLDYKQLSFSVVISFE